jgi:hypothetical protein
MTRCNFREVGELASQPENAIDDQSSASCVDWYGNAGPLFLRGRLFALLGYEPVEGALTMVARESSIVGLFTGMNQKIKAVQAGRQRLR